MPAVQYPFIDIAVHPRIRERFARGEAMALFSIGLDRVLWANGAGAGLFGYAAIYDFIEQGAKQGDVSFRQVTSTAHQLSTVGDTRSFLIRIAAGFQRVVVNATVEMVRIQAGEQAILFSCPVSSKDMDTSERARRMLEGFDDPDTHMAVMGRDGEIIASSTGFSALGITPHTASMLVTMAGTQPERLIKRPIPTGQGYLPAAIGRLSEEPALHLLFVVEMVIGHLDPVEHAAPSRIAEVAVPAAVAAERIAETASHEANAEPALVEERQVERVTESTPAEKLVDTTVNVPHAHVPEFTSPNDQPDMLAAIPAASLPIEAAAHALHEAEELAPDAVAEFPDNEPAETVAAISAAELPPVAATFDAPVKQDLIEDLAPTPASAPENFPDHVTADPSHVASAEGWHSDWETSDIPPLTSSEIASFADALEPAADAEKDVPGPEDETPVHDIAHHIGPGLPAAELPEETKHAIEPDAAAEVSLETLPEANEDAVHPGAADVVADEAVAHSQAAGPVQDNDFSAVIDAVSEIEDLDEEPNEISDEEQDVSNSAKPALHDVQDALHFDDQPAAAEKPVEADQFSASSGQEYESALGGERHAPVVMEQDSNAIDATIEQPPHPGVDLASEQPLAEIASAEQSTESRVEADDKHDDGAPAFTASSEALPAVEDVVSIPEAVPVLDAAATHFVFNRNGRATRFVWKIDAEGRFSEISREFAEAVGPHATSVTGVAFADIAALFNLDPDGKIAELLAKRDTWSGRTIHWPVEGTTLTVPVDLAALPTYTRSREFDGFRGFGVVRLSDATEDPLKIGLTLAADAVSAAPEETAALQTEEAAVQPEVIEAQGIAEQAHVEPTESTETAETVAAEPSTQDAEPTAVVVEEPELPFNGEPPALRIVESPARRLSDKIIQLHEHRLAISDTLSPSEQAAFREIGKQLQPFGKRTEPPVETTEQAEAAEHDEAIAATPDHPDDGAADVLNADVPARPDEDENVSSEPAEPETAAGNAGEFDALSVLNTAIPPRSKMTDGLSAAAIDQLPVAILVHAGDALMHANPEFLRLTGYGSLAEIEGVGGLEALLQRHDLQEKAERPGTMVLVRADDALVPVTARLQSIRWEDSSALLLALMPVEKAGDISDAALAGEARDEARPERMLEKVAKLQVEVEELQSILETATDGVAIIGPEGDIRSMNRSASALFNYDEQETRGKPFIMLFAHESQKAVLDYLSGLTGNGVASLLNDGREVIGREASGGFVPLFMTMGVLTSSNGYCAVIRDITQWKRTEEELRNAKRAAETANAHKTDFLARVSHEIRTPLNAIVGFSDMMASERLGPIGHPRYVEYAGDIGRSGRHVLDIVNDLLDISKIEAGEMDLEFGSVGLNAAISEAVSIVQPQANGQRVIIRTALSQAVPNVVADLRSIKQIALNILANAIRFTPSGGQIVVSTSYEGNGSVIMRIRDTGVGMTRTELEQAMKPFRQVTTNSRQRGEGTGLGLPLTKAMVDANRALFAIHSAPNEGTLVEITFPSPRVLAN